MIQAAYDRIDEDYGIDTKANQVLEETEPIIQKFAHLCEMTYRRTYQDVPICILSRQSGSIDERIQLNLLGGGVGFYIMGSVDYGSGRVDCEHKMASPDTIEDVLTEMVKKMAPWKRQDHL